MYRARIVGGPGEDSRRARVLIYAAPPDRIHVEVVSAVGTTHAILDSGGGRLAITLPRDRISYVGAVDPRAVLALIGLEAHPEQLVRALLEGRAEGFEVERRGEPGALPEHLHLRTAVGALELRLRSLDRLSADVATLGTGVPPAGMTSRPLDELLADPSATLGERP